MSPCTIRVAGFNQLVVHAFRKQLSDLFWARHKCTHEDIPITACVLRSAADYEYSVSDGDCVTILVYSTTDEQGDRELEADEHVVCVDTESIQEACSNFEISWWFDWCAGALKHNRQAREEATFKATQAIRARNATREADASEPAAKRRRIAVLLKELHELTKTDV